MAATVSTKLRVRDVCMGIRVAIIHRELDPEAGVVLPRCWRPL